MLNLRKVWLKFGKLITETKLITQTKVYATIITINEQKTTLRNIF
jgi:hypothetical protein